MFKRLIASLVCLTFSLSNIQYVHAQAGPAIGGDFSVNQLPVPGTMVGKSAPFAPLALKGMIVNPLKPLEFQFIVDTGRGPQDTISVKDQANQLLKYFLAGLTIPEGDLWVNLSPYEKDRMVPTALGQTDLGRDLLAQDYILKQLTASLIYPEKDLGKAFWSRVYAKAQAQFGTTNVPVNTFNKVWILPNQAQVYENGSAAYVTKSTLKVMLDEDYLALQKHSAASPLAGRNETHSIGANIVREIILPEIEKEVNTGKNFAPLRQIYQALILAKWYKETIQNGLLDAVYTNKKKVAGVNLEDPAVKDQIYNRYLQAYKKGAFNYIKEDLTPDGQVVPRKYFSGGTLLAIDHLEKTPSNSAMLAKGWLAGTLLLFTVGCTSVNTISIENLPTRQPLPPVYYGPNFNTYVPRARPEVTPRPFVPPRPVAPPRIYRSGHVMLQTPTTKQDAAMSHLEDNIKIQTLVDRLSELENGHWALGGYERDHVYMDEYNKISDELLRLGHPKGEFYFVYRPQVYAANMDTGEHLYKMAYRLLRRMSSYLDKVANEGQTLTEIARQNRIDGTIIRLLNPGIDPGAPLPLGTAIRLFNDEIKSGGVDTLKNVLPGINVLLFDNDHFWTWPTVEMTAKQMEAVIRGHESMPKRYRMSEDQKSLLIQYLKKGGIAVFVSGGDINNLHLRIAQDVPGDLRKNLVLVHAGGKQVFGYNGSSSEPVLLLDLLEEYYEKAGISKFEVKEKWMPIIAEAEKLFGFDQDKIDGIPLPIVRVDRREDTRSIEDKEGISYPGYPVQVTFEFDQRHDFLKQSPLEIRQRIYAQINQKIAAQNVKINDVNDKIPLLDINMERPNFIPALQAFLQYRYKQTKFNNGQTLAEHFGFLSNATLGFLDTGTGGITKQQAVKALIERGVIGKMLGRKLKGSDILVGEDSVGTLKLLLKGVAESDGSSIDNKGDVRGVLTPKANTTPRDIGDAELASKVTIVNDTFGPEGITKYMIAHSLPDKFDQTPKQSQNVAILSNLKRRIDEFSFDGGVKRIQDIEDAFNELIEQSNIDLQVIEQERGQRAVNQGGFSNGIVLDSKDGEDGRKVSVNKLVRDKIPEILRQQNVKFISHIAKNDEYRQYLILKLQEEFGYLEKVSLENESADKKNRLIHELAALNEVVNTIKDQAMQIKASPEGGIDFNQINVKRNGKIVNVQFDPAQLNELMQGGFKGFTPVITNITPISSPFQLLGVNIAKETEALVKAYARRNWRSRKD